MRRDGKIISCTRYPSDCKGRILAGEIEDKSTPKMQRSVVTKWVDLDSMNSLGLTSGVKKVRSVFPFHVYQRFLAAYDVFASA